MTAIAQVIRQMPVFYGVISILDNLITIAGCVFVTVALFHLELRKKPWPYLLAALLCIVLGAGDYEAWAGWMTTVNDAIISVSACDLILTKDAANAYNNTYVIRWQFALASMDASLGYVSWDGSSFFTHANKDKAMIAYADSSNARAKMNAKATLEKLDATQAEVDATIEPLGKAETVWDRIVMFFDNILSFFRRLLHIG